MTVSNVAAHNYPIVVSYDGGFYSGYPAGDKPAGYQTAPTIHDTDIQGITLVNNYNGNGSWVKVYGQGFGAFAALGTSIGARVYLRDPLDDNAWHEVAAYTSIGVSKVFTKNQWLQIEFQVGHGYAFISPHPLDLKITVNGTDSNILTGQLINVGARDFYFVSVVHGNDSTGVKNDPTHPYLSAQLYNSSTHVYGGYWAAWQVGDTAVFRGEGTNWTSQAGVDGRFWAFPRGPADGSWTGAAPTGSAGTGWYNFRNYPGETPHGVFATGGGPQGCDTARAQAGYGKYWTVSGFHFECGTSTPADGGPINLQYGADFTFISDCELGPWPSTLTAPNDAKAGALSGQSYNTSVIACVLHDIDGDHTIQQNHGIYVGGAAGGTGYSAGSKNWKINGNWVYNIFSGSMIQFFWQNTDGNPLSIFSGNVIKNNWLESSNVASTAGKYGINLGTMSVSFKVFNNVIVNAGWDAFRVAAPAGQAIDIEIGFNTVIGWNAANNGGTGGYAFLTESDTGLQAGSSIKINHNIFEAHTRNGGAFNDWYGNNGGTDTPFTMDQNVYWDTTRTNTGSASKDAHPITTDPLLTAPTAGNPTLSSTSSSAYNAVTTTEAVSPAVTRDIFAVGRPVATHKCAGACEGVGT